MAKQRKEDRARKALESNLLTKPQFEEVQVEEVIAEEYGGVSTLGRINIFYLFCIRNKVWVVFVARFKLHRYLPAIFDSSI